MSVPHMLTHHHLYFPPTIFSLSVLLFISSLFRLQNDNETAVWIASKEGYPEIVKALVAAGADLSIASVSTIVVTVTITHIIQ